MNLLQEQQKALEKKIAHLENMAAGVAKSLEEARIDLAKVKTAQLDTMRAAHPAATLPPHWINAKP